MGHRPVTGHTQTSQPVSRVSTLPSVFCFVVVVFLILLKQSDPETLHLITINRWSNCQFQVLPVQILRCCFFKW